MFNKEVYITRREQLRKKMNSGIIIIFGNSEKQTNLVRNYYRFRQDHTFTYLFGIRKPGLIGIIDIDEGEDYLFGSTEHEQNELIWLGKQYDLQELAERVGVKQTLSTKVLDSFISKNINRPIHFPPPPRMENRIFLSNLLGIKETYLDSKSSKKLIKALVEMRSVKDSFEIEELTKAANIAYIMHTIAMKLCISGRTELDIAGIIEGVAIANGSRIPHPTILTQDGQILHNYAKDTLLKKGRFMLTNAGAESQGYSSDFCRTTPVDGVFSEKQKDIYSIVLRANEKVRKAARPGVSYKDMQLLAGRSILEGLKNLGLIKGNLDTAVRRGVYALFMPHGVGHMIGLNVHDMKNYGEDIVGYSDDIKKSKALGLSQLRLGRELREGFTITNEPGIYFIPELIKRWEAEGKFKNFIKYDKLETYMDIGGIRLEDELLITSDGAKIIGDERIPITIEEVERCVKEI